MTLPSDLKFSNFTFLNNLTNWHYLVKYNNQKVLLTLKTKSLETFSYKYKKRDIK